MEGVTHVKLAKRDERGFFPTEAFLLLFVIILITVTSAMLILGYNSYNQNKQYYENFMNQLSTRTNVLIDDFISNSIRITFFYLTDSNLTKIITNQQDQNDLELLEHRSLMQKAMDQIVLMNGSISGITVSTLNGTIFSSSGAYSWNLTPILYKVLESSKHKGQAVVSAPYIEKDGNNYDKNISIIRYIHDSDMKKNNKDAFAKVDIKFRTIGNMLGGISNSDTELGTIVVSDGKMIYNSYTDAYRKANDKVFEDHDIQLILSHFENGDGLLSKAMQFKVNDVEYLFTATRNKSTNWVIIQYIPTQIIKNEFQKIVFNYVLISLLSLCIVFFLAVFFSNRFFKPINNLRVTMKLVDSGTLDHVVNDNNRKDEIGQLVRSYNAMILRLAESRKREIEAHRLQKKSELNMLQAQINPHFLYNTLNVISSISELHHIEEISIISRSLARLYRYNIKSKDNVTIENELEQLENYINIQSIRFLDKVNISYDIDEELYRYKILKFLLQPIVENAFQHGLQKKGGKGSLLISITKSGHNLHIIVKDDGLGMDEEKVRELNASLSAEIFNDTESTTGIGLRSVYSRIKHFYGNEYTLKVSSKRNEGTCVEMIIPSEKEADAI